MQLRIYDVAGRLVRTLVDAPFEIGRHGKVWDGLDDAGKHVPSSVYFYRLTAPATTQTRKLVVAR